MLSLISKKASSSEVRISISIFAERVVRVVKNCHGSWPSDILCIVYFRGHFSPERCHGFFDDISCVHETSRGPKSRLAALSSFRDLRRETFCAAPDPTRL